jgi:pilus assembly protein Flp/PilA
MLDFSPHIGSVTSLPLLRGAYTWAGPHMKSLFSNFLKDESGATAIEYGLIAAGIAVAIITAVQGLGVKLSGTFDTLSTSLK